MVFFLKNYLQSCTLEMFLSYVFMYGKLVTIVLFILSNSKLAYWYAFICFCTWVILQYPRYRGRSKIIKIQSLEQLQNFINIDEIEQHIKDQGTKKISRPNFATTNTTVLIFTTEWSDMCYFTYAMWYRFASRFSTEKVKFLEINADKCKKIAKMFKISTEPS